MVLLGLGVLAGGEGGSGGKEIFLAYDGEVGRLCGSGIRILTERQAVVVLHHGVFLVGGVEVGYCEVGLV